VAADFLVPLTEFREEWDRARSFADNCNHLRSIFKVSGLVIARRAREQHLVGKASTTSSLRSRWRLLGRGRPPVEDRRFC